MTASLLFTDSELCALHRVRKYAMPRFVTESDTDDVRLDVVALRGLAARELVAFDAEDDTIWLSPAAERLLGSCQAPALIAEVESETAGRMVRHAVVAGADGRLAVFGERPWGLVSVTSYDGELSSVLRSLTGLDRDVAPGNHVLTVGSGEYLRADGLLAANAPDAAVDALVCAGASLPAAHAWVRALDGRRATVLVNVVRDIGAGTFVAVELGWVEAADGTVWQITTDSAGDDDWEQPEPAASTTVRQVDGAVLRDALAEVCEPNALGAPR